MVVNASSDRVTLFCKSMILVHCMLNYVGICQNLYMNFFHHITSGTPDDVTNYVQKTYSESGNIRFLIICTSAAVRLNFSSVTYVVQYSPPQNADIFCNIWTESEGMAIGFNLLLYCSILKRGRQ